MSKSVGCFDTDIHIRSQKTGALWSHPLSVMDGASYATG